MTDLFSKGFLPHKKGRQTRLQKLQMENRSIVFYESPHRLLKTLSQFEEFFGLDRQISISREISKVYEETLNCSIGEALEHFRGCEPKGEFVMIVAPLGYVTDKEK